MKSNLIIDTSYSRLDEFIAKQTQLSEKTGEVYLTAGGYYQECYIAIFEELTSTDDSKYSDTEIVEANVEFIAELFVKEMIKKFPDRKFPFNKIVSVTLPSQIIAKAIHQSLKKYTDIEFYVNKNKIEYAAEMPKLVRLASYYSFYEEVQFKNIVSGDKVLVVNDVISTGNLIKDIHDSISSIKDNEGNSKAASISCVLSVVDSRVSDKNIDIKKHKKSFYFKTTPEFSEDMFLSLTKKEILKFKENPHPDKKLVRINPILNARITIESRHSEEDKIAFKKAEDFLKKIPLDAMAIGHFSQNSLHHPYFIKSEELFREDDVDGNVGVKLVKNIYNEIINKEQKYDLDFHIKSISHQLNSFEELLGEYEPNSKLKVEKLMKELIGHLERVKKIAKHKKSEKSPKVQTLSKKDFVFYPVFSGIENLTVENIHDIFRVDYSNIIPLQRFDTNKGWRFIIPQKSFNNRLRGQKALIIDMGSFTGDSIIQMIDALCVFELKKIIVISLVGRLEDFDREFFSRIREMKVKVLNAPSKPSKLQNAIIENTLAPVNIYFGTNLHIPPSSQSKKACEHCQEASDLEEYKEVKEFQATSAINYINDRLAQLTVHHVNDIENKCPKYFPKSSDGTFDVLSFFTVRDHLGKIDGYRFYTDYYTYFDDLKVGSKEFKERIEAIIAVTLHEKHLVKTIENQLPDVKQKVIGYINEVINSENGIATMHYQWETLSILESYFLFNKTVEVFELKNFMLILEFIAKHSKNTTADYSFIAFKMAEVYNNNKTENTYFQNQLVKSVKEIWQEIEDNNSLKYYPLIAKFNRIIVNDKMAVGTEDVKPFYNLFNMYDTASGYKPSHTDLGVPIDNLYTSIVAQNIHQSLSDAFFDLNFRKEYDKAKIDLQDLLQNSSGVSNYLNSLNKLFSSNKFAPEYFSGEKSMANYLSKIDGILKSNAELKSHYVEIQTLLKEIQDEYFTPSKVNSFYTLWKSSSHISVEKVWQKLKGESEVNHIDLFNEYVDYKNYHDLIKANLSCLNIAKEDSYTDVGVNIHPFLLIKVCKELLDNSFKYAKGSSICLTLKEIYSEELDLRYSVFVFHQNKCSQGKPEKGLEAVEKIIKDFRGQFKYLDEDPNELTIEIAIPITKYKIN